MFQRTLRPAEIVCFPQPAELVASVFSVLVVAPRSMSTALFFNRDTMLIFKVLNFPSKTRKKFSNFVGKGAVCRYVTPPSHTESARYFFAQQSSCQSGQCQLCCWFAAWTTAWAESVRCSLQGTVDVPQQYVNVRNAFRDNALESRQMFDGRPFLTSYPEVSILGSLQLCQEQGPKIWQGLSFNSHKRQTLPRIRRQ